MSIHQNILQLYDANTFPINVSSENKYSLLFMRIIIVYLDISFIISDKSTTFLLNQFQQPMLLKFGLGTLGLLTLAKVYESTTDSYVFTRNLRTIRCGLHILYAYKIAFNENNYLDIHEGVAEDIYNTCIQNDGLYVKFGQGIATMDHMLPPPFYKHLSKLQDKAKAASFKKIKKVFEEDVGKSFDEVFQFFQSEPVASASLAQVHRARLKTGQQVAVKIQKPNIQKQFSSDMIMHYLINWVLEKSFDLPLLHFVDDIQANLKKQLDFRIEAQNSIRGQKNFEKLKRSELYVPKVINQFTRERVMVSQWIDGFKITDTEKLKHFNFNKKHIMNDVIRAFAEQIFVSGFIHCDPHPGNVFIRPHPLNKKKHQIVILDFGLCLEISQKFRLSYANFWKSMFLNDQQEMKRICKEWGMNYNDSFAGWQLMRPYSKNKLMTKKVQKQDVIRMQLEMKGKIKEIMKDTINFPKELLFISRNMNLVRSLNKFHGGAADRISIMAQAAFIGSTIQLSQNAKRSFHFYYQSFKFSMSLWLMNLLDWIMQFWSGKNLQTYVEDETIKKAQEMFKTYGFKPINQSTYNS